jgi:hypothetical protein
MKEILIVTTSSRISYQLKDIYSIVDDILTVRARHAVN